MDKPRIVNLNELPEPKGREHDDRFASRHVLIGARVIAFKKDVVDYWAGE